MSSSTSLSLSTWLKSSEIVRLSSSSSFDEVIKSILCCFWERESRLEGCFLLAFLEAGEDGTDKLSFTGATEDGAEAGTGAGAGTGTATATATATAGGKQQARNRDE